MLGKLINFINIWSKQPLWGVKQGSEYCAERKIEDIKYFNKDAALQVKNVKSM